MHDDICALKKDRNFYGINEQKLQLLKSDMSRHVSKAFIDFEAICNGRGEGEVVVVSAVWFV